MSSVDPFARDDERYERTARPRDWVAAAVLTVVVSGGLLGALAFTVQWFLTNVYNVGQ